MRIASGETSSTPLADAAAYIVMAMCAIDGNCCGGYTSVFVWHRPVGVEWEQALPFAGPASSFLPRSINAALVPIRRTWAALQRERTSFERVICNTRLRAFSFSWYTPACLEFAFLWVRGWTAAQPELNAGNRGSCASSNFTWWADMAGLA